MDAQRIRYMDTSITSTQNQKIKDLLHLRERRDRDTQSLFLIEGYRELTRASSGNVSIGSLFICLELFLGENEQALIQEIGSCGAAIIPCSEKVFRKISYRDRPDGLIGVAKQMKLTLSDLEKALNGIENPLLVVAEAIEKPGNLGTILRSSDGAGAHGVIICDRCTDIYNPNVVRASVGTLFTLPVIETTSVDAIAWLKKRGIAICAATPHASQKYFDADFSKACAIAVGTEQLGLTKQWMQECDIQVQIPMCGTADSLNVAMATTILLFEAQRQRQ